MRTKSELELFEEQLLNNQRISTMFKWWERKRLYFNILVGLAGLLTIIFCANTFGVIEIFGCLFWGIVANIFYSFGFTLEIANIYYLKGRIPYAKIKLGLFVIGTGLYCLVTLVYGFSYFTFYQNFNQII